MQEIVCVWTSVFEILANAGDATSILSIAGVISFLAIEARKTIFFSRKTFACVFRLRFLLVLGSLTSFLCLSLSLIGHVQMNTLPISSVILLSSKFDNPCLFLPPFLRVGRSSTD